HARMAIRLLSQRTIGIFLENARYACIFLAFTELEVNFGTDLGLGGAGCRHLAAGCPWPVAPRRLGPGCARHQFLRRPRRCGAGPYPGPAAATPGGFGGKRCDTRPDSERTGRPGRCRARPEPDELLQ